MRTFSDSRLILVCLTVVAVRPPPAAAETIVAQQAAIDSQYAAQLEELARWCDTQNLAEQATATRQWIVRHAPLTLIVALPDARLPEAGGEASEAIRDWTERFRQLRQAQGKRLFALAQAAADDRKFALAFQLAHATLREDPDHESARRLLGYKRHEGKWLTPFELNKAQANEVWHERFGWLQRKQVPRYESGERFNKNRWVSAADDAWLHADIDQGWTIATEHYQVCTNHSLEEGVRLAARLEEFYGVWRQVFVRYHSTDAQLARLFRDGAPPKGTPRRTPHQVTCFRDREEYNAALRREHPNIGITTGYYLGRARTAYFFAGPEQDDSNIYHEATHQLFYELVRPVKDVGRDANFWIIEGIACLMESYQPANHLVLLGGLDALRLKNARTYLQRDGFYVGVADLCGLGMDALQRHDNIKEVYGEAAGMTYFLMYADEGRYRQALVDYLAAVHAHRDRSDTLAELTGASYSKLDEQYQHFIRNLP